MRKTLPKLFLICNFTQLVLNCTSYLTSTAAAGRRRSETVGTTFAPASGAVANQLVATDTHDANQRPASL